MKNLKIVDVHGNLYRELFWESPGPSRLCLCKPMDIPELFVLIDELQRDYIQLFTFPAIDLVWSDKFNCWERGNGLWNGRKIKNVV